MGDEPRIVLKEESYRLMGLLFEVHNKLGPIYKEINYQDAIESVLKKEGVAYQREKDIGLMMNGERVGEFLADFIVNNQILVEVKAKRFIKHDDIRQASRMIKSANLPLAILANFKRNKLEYKRIINPAFEKDSGKIRERLEKEILEKD